MKALPISWQGPVYAEGRIEPWARIINHSVAAATVKSPFLPKPAHNEKREDEAVVTQLSAAIPPFP